MVACRPAAELASFWNKPMVSWVATDPDFSDKTVYTTLGRTFGPFNKMGSFLVEIFKQYNWRKVVVISSNYFIWLDAGKAIRKVCYPVSNHLHTINSAIIHTARTYEKSSSRNLCYARLDHSRKFKKTTTINT